MIDTHAHIDGNEFDDDRELIIDRAKKIGITNIIIPTIEPNRFEKLWKVVNSDDMLYCGYGVHPNSANEYNDIAEKYIISKLNEKKVVAVGEIGLDYYYDYSSKETQRKVFEQQLNIAKQYLKPVIVHNRESDNDILDLIESVQKNGGNELTGVLHCFSSDISILKKALDLNFYFSFTGNITFKNSKLDEIVKYVPNDKFMIETDSPYITPVPFRGKRNEPSYVSYIAEKISEIKNIEIKEIINMTTKNALNLFKLSLILLCFNLVNFSNLEAQIKTNNQNAQIQTTEEEVLEDEYYDEEEVVNPYKRKLGFGFFGGPNTIVVTEYYKQGEGPDGVTELNKSNEGFIFYGGSLQYSPFDFLILESSYYTSKDNKLALQFPGREADYYNGFEISSLWIANPTKRINFFGGVGGTLLMNNLNNEKSTAFGLNFSIGFIGNIKFDNVGLFNIVAQWRLNPRFGRQAQSFPQAVPNTNPAQFKTVELEASQFFSMPRFSLIWYPEF